jgi:hypothetical protein
MVLSYLALRLIVGVIGVLLPWAMILGNWGFGGFMQTSISAYYYTSMRNVFVGALFALAAFLIAYRGYDLADGIITNIAGGAAIGIALFPTTPFHATGHQAVIGDIHITFAVTSFLMLAVMALRFAKQEPTPPGLSFWRRIAYAFGFTGPGTSTRPLWKTVLYRVCGFTIIASIALIIPVDLVWSYALLAFEAVILTAFGVSWFVKGSAVIPGG